MDKVKIPVLFCIFKRMEALEAFNPIRQYKPERLYIAADGPRENVSGEKEDCEKVRKAILDRIDWPCDVKTLFRDKNLGCTEAIYRGICWFFDQEEYGVINEDDVVISPDFFKMCEQLLPLYKEEGKIWIISSRNHSGKWQVSDEYCFVYFANIWGWATWRRAWNINNNRFVGWDKFSIFQLIKRYGLIQGLIVFNHYYKCQDPDTNFGSWDYTWTYIYNKNEGLTICPKVNLSRNVGIGVKGSTNYDENDKDPYNNLKVGKIMWPLKIKDEISVDRIQLKYDRKDYLRIRYIGLKKKVYRFFSMKS